MSKPDPVNEVDPDESKSGSETNNSTHDTPDTTEKRPKEVGGRGGLDPTRYGDWEKAGRCVDF